MKSPLLACSALSIAALWASTAPLASAQVATGPATDQLVVRVDLDAMRDCQFGKRLLDLAKTLIEKEIAEKQKDGPGMDAVTQALGFDPFNDLQSVNLALTNIQSPEQGVAVAIQLRETTGNAEGLMLALPEYESKQVSGQTIHSFRNPEQENMRFHVAFTDGPGSSKLIVVALTPDALLSKLSNPTSAMLDSEEGPFVQVKLGDLSGLQVGEGPQKNIAKMVQGLAVAVDENGDDVEVSLSMTAEDDQRAEQLQQLSQGMMAMINIAKDMKDADKEIKHLAEILARSSVSREGSDVRVELKLASDLIIQFLKSEAGLPL